MRTQEGPRVFEEVLKKRSIRTFSLKEGMMGVMLTFTLKLQKPRVDMRSTKTLYNPARTLCVLTDDLIKVRLVGEYSDHLGGFSFFTKNGGKAMQSASHTQSQTYSVIAKFVFSKVSWQSSQAYLLFLLPYVIFLVILCLFCLLRILYLVSINCMPFFSF